MSVRDPLLVEKQRFKNILSLFLTKFIFPQDQLGWLPLAFVIMILTAHALGSITFLFIVTIERKILNLLLVFNFVKWSSINDVTVFVGQGFCDVNPNPTRRYDGDKGCQKLRDVIYLIKSKKLSSN